MKNNQIEKSKAGFRPGFSKRFNCFLDIADYPEVNKGRMTLLAEDEDMSQSGVRKWITEDNPPKGSKLIEVCHRIINERMNGKYNPNLIAGWLEYGDEIVPNPFENSKSIEHNHAVMSNIYVLVHNTAKELGVDIYSMEAEILDPLYQSIMDDVVSHKLSEADSAFVKSLLIIAQKKSDKS